MCDKKATMNITKNLVHHKRTKHINVRYHFLWDNVMKGFEMVFCKMEDQVSDIFTKALARDHFEKNHFHLDLIWII